MTVCGTTLVTESFASHIMIDTDGTGDFSCTDLFEAEEPQMTFVAPSGFAAVVADVFGKEYLADIDME